LMERPSHEPVVLAAELVARRPMALPIALGSVRSVGVF
jgi:hypothetical protein